MREIVQQYLDADIRVTEKRAPTDESVRLLKEFEEKAREKIVDTVHIQNNVVEAVVIYYQDDIIFDRLNYFLKFTLNGSTHKMEGNITRRDYETEKRNYYRGTVFNVLLKRYSELIAEQLLIATGDSIPKSLL